VFSYFIPPNMVGCGDLLMRILTLYPLNLINHHACTRDAVLTSPDSWVAFDSILELVPLW